VNKDYEGRIAIVGLAGRMPGSDSLDEFWQALVEGKSLLTQLDEDALIAAGVSETVRRHPNYVPVASSMSDIDCFDHNFFGYSLREAAIIDPQQRILLELAHEAFEHAGYVPDQIDAKVGVYLGSGYCNYLVNNLSGDIDPNDQLSGLQILMGNDKEYATTRISYKLNLKGPSVSVNSACSTSLVAIHQACRALQAYECDYALAGAAKVNIPNQVGYTAQEGGISSRDGTCRPYDADGSGPVFGSGAGVVVLKRVEDAIADGDTIYAVIRGSAVNNDGSSKVSFSAPSTDGQIEVIADALADAGVAATAIGYVEGHGTSTPLGDPIEVAALSELYKSEGVAIGSCYLGSVKANVGHLEAAAGMAGLFKVIYALRNNVIPPQLNFRSPNKNIPLAQTPFSINQQATAWLSNKRLAALSSFGIGGTNGHLIVQAYQAAEQQLPTISGPIVLPLSATTDEQVTKLQTAYQSYPIAEDSLAAAAFTAALGRQHYPKRKAIVAESYGELQQKLQQGGVKPAEAIAIALTANDWNTDGWQFDNSMLANSLRNYARSIEKAIKNVINTNALESDVLTRLPAATIPLLAYAVWLKSSGIQLSVIYSDATSLPVTAFIAGSLSLDDAILAIFISYGIAAGKSIKAISLGQGAIKIIDLQSQKVISGYWTPQPVTTSPVIFSAEKLPKVDVVVGAVPTAIINRNLLLLIARAYVRGDRINWRSVYSGLSLPKIALPTYPFAKISCWIDPKTKKNNSIVPSTTQDSIKAFSKDALLEHIANFVLRPATTLTGSIQFQRDLLMESMMIAEFNASLKTAFGLNGSVPLTFYFEGGDIDSLFTKLQKIPALAESDEPSAVQQSGIALAQISHWRETSVFPELQRVERRQVHKHFDKNVLVARTASLGSNLFIAEITQDVAHEYYYEHAQDHVPGLYMIEAARQAATAIVHQFYDVPYGYKFILNDLQSSFSGFAELNAPLFLSINFQNLAKENGVLKRALAQVEFIQGDKVIGTMQSQAVIFEPQNYNHVRDGHAVIAG
jgi:phthiocerol/phenolphthiocerol synthesis type-I polyketide synthase E